MKKLYLIRHAKSSWADLDMDDFDRPLNDRGEKDAPHMAKLMKHHDVVPARMISSPAKRALSTCLVFAKVLKFDPAKIIADKSLYHAGADQLLNVVRSLAAHPGDQDDVVLLFGHNPGLTEFANALLNVSIDNVPTCGIVGATLDVGKWRDINFGCGKLNSFEYPKMNA